MALFVHCNLCELHVSDGIATTASAIKEAPACFLLLLLLLPSSSEQHLTTPCLHTPSSRVFWDANWGSTVFTFVCVRHVSQWALTSLRSANTPNMFPLRYLNGQELSDWSCDGEMEPVSCSTLSHELCSLLTWLLLWWLSPISSHQTGIFHKIWIIHTPTMGINAVTNTISIPT